MKFSKMMTMAAVILAVACGTTQPSSYYQRAKEKAQAAAEKAKSTYYETVKPKVTGAYEQVRGSMSDLRDKAADVSSSVKNKYFRDYRPSAAQQAAEEQNMAEMNEWARSQGLMGQ